MILQGHTFTHKCIDMHTHAHIGFDAIGFDTIGFGRTTKGGRMTILMMKMLMMIMMMMISIFICKGKHGGTVVYVRRNVLSPESSSILVDQVPHVRTVIANGSLWLTASHRYRFRAMAATMMTILT